MNKDLRFEVINPHLDAFKSKVIINDNKTLINLVLGVTIFVIFLIVSFILPIFDFFRPIEVYPNDTNIFSFYLLFIYLLTAFSIAKFGMSSMSSSLQYLRNYKKINVETLICIASLAAIFLAHFLIITYAIELSYNTQDVNSKKFIDDKSEKIHEVCHMLESSAVVFVIISLGKYIEKRAKSMILAMT